MAVTLPSGWKNFSGGGSDPSLCGEPQDCDNPPCGDIPPLVIVPIDGEGAEIAPEFICARVNPLLLLRADGGVPPFTWSTTRGTIESTGPRTAILRLNAFHNENVESCAQAPGRNADAAYIQRGYLEGQGEHGGENIPCDVLEGGGLVYNCNGEVIGAADATEETPIVGSIRADDFTCTHAFENSPDVQECNVSSTSAPGITTIYKHLYAHPDQGLIEDVRTPELIAAGCQPCIYLSGETLVVVATDATGVNTALEITII